MNGSLLIATPKTITLSHSLIYFLAIPIKYMATSREGPAISRKSSPLLLAHFKPHCHYLRLKQAHSSEPDGASISSPFTKLTPVQFSSRPEAHATALAPFCIYQLRLIASDRVAIFDAALLLLFPKFHCVLPCYLSVYMCPKF